MLCLNNILMHVFQPYFYYSTILLVVSFICVKLFTKYNLLLTTRVKSICYLIPLTFPVLLATVNILWPVGRFFFESRILIRNQLDTALLIKPPIPIGNPSYILIIHTNGLLPVLPVTSFLYAVGFAIALVYLIVTTTLGDRIVRRVFHVIELDQGEYESLQKEIKRLSVRMGINPPKVGLVEDLRPNAFVMGYGRRTILVFSLGLLKTLTKKELVAVAAHELSHVKNHDFVFKTLSTALSMISFFNPFAHFSSTSAQRERENLADEDCVKIIGNPCLFKKAIIKINKASLKLHGEGFTTRLMSSLFLSSPISVGTLFSTHPKLEYRVRNIEKLNRREDVEKNSLFYSMALSILVIALGVLSVYLLASIQISFVRQYFPPIFFRTPLERPFFIKLSSDRTRSIHVPGYLERRERNYDPRIIDMAMLLSEKGLVIKPSENNPLN
ncbi:MAG: M48 family metalloprotease [Candidatus Brockarchaeota archaeon]|nr:M48 family metalloprotease [Candidatus Brockarchaeota archaeon]